MKYILPVLISFFIITKNGFAHNPAHDEEIRFIENKNQWDERVEYKAEIKSGAVYLEKGCFTYNLVSRTGKHPYTKAPDQGGDSIRFRGHAFKVKFRNSNPDVDLNPAEEYSDYYNYFIGKDRSKWASKVRAFNSVTYQDLYRGIDLKVYSQGINLKYDFIILPNVNPSIIQLDYVGVDRMILKDGNLLLFTSLGTVTEQKPYAYQYIKGKLLAIPCIFVLEGNTVSFGFPSGYDKNYPVTIDPVLIFSTYSGSFADNFGYSAAPDSKGFLFGGSSVFGTGYPVTSGAYQKTFAGGAPYLAGGTDIGITKYDTTGTKRIYSTYLGGNSDELPHSLIVNDQDELYIYGTTSSPNFPITKGAYDSTFAGGIFTAMFGIEVVYDNGSDIFVAKLSADGSSLLASTFLGGSANDGLLAQYYNIGDPISGLRYNYADEVRGEIELDKSSNVYIASCTRSTNFPTVGTGIQNTYGGGKFDAVVVKLDQNLQNVLWSTFLGGTNDDAAYSIELDSLDNPYVGGGTISNNFPTTTGTLYTVNQTGRSDGFISYLNKDGSAIIYSTYYGSTAYDQVYFIGLDKDNNVHVFGQTTATGPNATRYVKSAGFSNPNSGQFISKITPELDSVFWSTTFGNGSGRPNISPTAFLVDLCSKIYLSGWGGTPENTEFLNGINRPFNMPTTLGPNPATDYYQSSTDQHDFYLFVMEGDASAINYASFFGGNLSEEHVDGGTSRFDRKGKMYQAMCAGCGGNSDMPLTPVGGSPLPSHNNSFNCNIGVFKMDFRLPIVVADFRANDACIGDTITFTNLSQIKSNTHYQWFFGDGGTSTVKDPKHAYAAGGTYNVTLILSDSATCNLADTIVKQVYVSPIVPGISIDAIADQYTIYKGKSTIIRAIPSTGYDYEWSPKSYLGNPYASVTTAAPPVTTTYTVTFKDKRVNKCSVIDSVTIKVIEIICDEPYIFVPDAFTPNEDGKNELVYVRSVNIRDLYFTIYDRWGEKVFETRDQNIGWDGTYKGMKVDPGVFVYYLDATCVDDQKFFKKGNITVIK